MPSTVISLATTVGHFLADYAAARGLDAVWQWIETKGVVSKAIEKTDQRLTPSDNRPSGSSVRSSLENWTDDPGFKRLFRKLSEGEEFGDEDVVDHFIEKGEFHDSVERLSARKIVEHFLQNLRDELFNASGGRARMMREIDRMHAEDQTRYDQAEEERQEIRAKVESLTEPARRAVDAYLEESDEWRSPNHLIEKGDLSGAVDELERRLERVRELEEEYPEVTSLFRKHRQRLLLRAAQLHSQRGNRPEARGYYERAKGGGFADEERRQQALSVLLNLDREEEYRKVLQSGSVSKEDKARINLLVLEERWGELADRLPEEPQEFREAYLYAVAELSANEADIDAPVVADRLDQAEEMAGENPVRKAQLAIMTIELLQQVVDHMLETPELDRNELIESARTRIEEALSSYEDAEPDSGLNALLPRAYELFNLLGESNRAEEIREYYQRLSEGEVQEDWEEARQEGRISEAHFLFLKAGRLLKNPASVQASKARSLLESALHLSKEQELRKAIAEQLINLHIQKGEEEEVEAVLEQVEDLPNHKLFLLKLPIIRESEGKEGAIERLTEEVDANPRSVDLRRALMQLCTSRISDLAEDDPHSEKIEFLLSIVEEQAAELEELLPALANRIEVARAHFAARNYNDALNWINPVLDLSDPPLEAMQIQGEALVRLRRFKEAGDVIGDLAERSGDPMHAVNAAAFWIEQEKFEHVISFLEPWVESYPDNPLLSSNLAVALIASRSEYDDAGRRAFNLLSKACRKNPDLPNVNLLLSKAARIAGCDHVADRYFRRASSGTPPVIQEKEDVEEVWNTSGDGLTPFVLAGREGVEALVEAHQEYMQALNRLFRAEVLSYGDVFRRNGRPWAHWSQWVESARSAFKKNPKATAVKIPYPSVRREYSSTKSLLLDLSALLTLGSLGRTSEVLRTLRDMDIDLYIRSDDLELLNQSISNPVEYLFEPVDHPYRRLVEVLRKHDLLFPYDEDKIERFGEAVPAHLREHLQSSTPDFGLSLEKTGAVFVSDSQDTLDYSPESQEEQIITSSELLGVLVGSGMIAEDKADQAAEQRERFQDWRDAREREVPSHVVFSGFALPYWFDEGLLTTFENGWLQNEDGWPEIHIGPFAREHLTRQAEEQRIEELSDRKASDLFQDLQNLTREGTITVIPVEGQHSSDEEVAPHIRELSPYAARTVELADRSNLDVWSDDRVLGYLLWPFGHPLPLPEVKQEFRSFRSNHSEVELRTTEGILELLRDNEQIQEDTEELGYELVRLGYRPLNFRLAVSHLFRRFPYRSGSPRYRPLLEAIESTLDEDERATDNEKEKLPSVSSAPLRGMMVGTVIPRLIAHVWRVPASRSLDERRELADDLLEIALPNLRQVRQDLEPSFWIGILANTLSPRSSEATSSREEVPATEKREQQIRKAIEWFREVLLEETEGERTREVVREIEDYLIDFLRFQVWPALPEPVGGEQAESSTEETGSSIQERRSKLIISAIHEMGGYLNVLLGEDLGELVDPFLRRATGVLARIEGEHKAQSVVVIDDTEIEIREDEEEQFALRRFVQALNGDEQSVGLIRGDLTVEGEWVRDIPDNLRSESPDFPDSYRLPIKISLLRLLLREEVCSMPELLEAVIRRLRLLDPSLGRELQTVQESLVSEEKETQRRARESLIFAILGSPIFELQRDLRHAVFRLRQLDTSTLEAFLSPEQGRIDEEDPGQVEVQSGKEFPPSFITDLSVLYSEPGLLYDAAVHEVQNVLEKLEDDDTLDLSGVVGRLVLHAQSLTSSFRMARNLLTLLAFADEVDGSISFSLGDEEWTLRDWIATFVTSIVDGQADVSGVARRSHSHRVAHAAVLRLGANVAGSERHIQDWGNQFDEEREVIQQWIQATLLFSSRVLPFLRGRYGNPNVLEEAVTEVVRDSNIAFEEPAKTPDRFNPFLLGPHLLDHEVAAVFHVIATFIEMSEDSSEVLDPEEITKLAEKWKDGTEPESEQIYNSQVQEAFDVMDLQLPLSPHRAAEDLIESVQISTG